MSVTYKCQCCGCVEACDQVYTMPGKTRLGGTILGQAVCKGCHDECCAALEQFWAGEDHARTDRCSKCRCHFGDGGCNYAQRRLKADGTWELARLCSGCLDDFHKACTQAMTD